MSMFLVKSLISLVLLILVCVAMFTMFEILGRSEKKYNVVKLLKIHRANGIIYFLIFIFTAYFCISFIFNTRAELSPRSALHSLFALTILILFILKILFVKVYRQFYNQVKVLGLLIALISFVMVGSSAGYYLLVTGFGKNEIMSRIIERKEEAPQQTVKVEIKTDAESIKKGKELYESKCFSCHDPKSTKTTIGPGHKGILKNPFLPVSKKPATFENIVNQLRNPYRGMPSFPHLSDEEVHYLIAFLNTL